LFGGEIGHGVTQVFNTWVDRAVVPAMLPVIVADIHERVDPGDDAYFRATFEKFVGKTLEAARGARPEAQKRLERALEPLQATLKRQAFVCGTAPAYADYILFSVFQWARILSPPDVLAPDAPLHAWRERLLDLYGGFARNEKAA
jgi:glutathione S-transferase